MKRLSGYSVGIFCLLLVTFALISFNKADDKINIGFATTSERFSREVVPTVALSSHWKTTAWRGEKVHQQILVWSEAGLPTLGIKKINPLKNKNGRIIEARHVQAGFVGYVITDEYGDKVSSCKNDRRGQQFDSSWVADPIYIRQQIPAQRHAVQPIWVSVSVPATATAGTYTGSIEIEAGKKTILPITIEVLDRTLPPPAQWTFHLDLWQHPAAIARVANLPLWSKAHFDAMRPYYTMLAKAGQKVITTSIIHEPWDHQTYDDFPSLVKWIKKRDGSWQYDFSLFDRYVQFVMDCGIDQQINAYSMIPWKLSFTYFDEAAGKDTALTVSPGTEAYTQFWKPMLTQFAAHLKSKGWFQKTTIAMDERPMKSMQAVIQLLKTIDKDWKVTLAGNYHPEIEKDIFDYSVASQFQFDTAALKDRKATGKKSTFYTCCAEPFPNGFTYSPPDEHVWIGWYVAANNFDGYLRWAYNSWPKNPMQDSRFELGPGGDTYQIYPGAQSSIRFEKLIEGIQDFEKINVLKKEYKATNNKRALDRLEQALQAFQINKLKTEKAADMVNAVKPLLNVSKPF
mgnify:CR=1 FL=1